MLEIILLHWRRQIMIYARVNMINSHWRETI